MPRLPLTLLTKDYDYLGPLAAGDVVPEGVDLTFVRSTETALNRTLGDTSVGAGELSFSRHVLRVAEGDRSFIGIPFFIVRAFRHRCFFVPRGSSLRALADLRGRRIGTNEWPATGNTWSRAALREQGVSIQDIEWRVGPVDGAPSTRPQGVLPANVRPVPAGRTLRELLLGDEIDALMVPDPPAGFYEPDSPIVRLLPDYVGAERDYYRRTKVYPAHHIVGVRRDVFEKSPAAARSLYAALEASKARWLERINELTETTPWLIAEIEAAQALFGPDWNPAGVQGNLTMIQALCDELAAQGLASRRVAAVEVFADFERTR
jgi:4,5-dihydroxyphthalate decarboxylase